MVKAKQQAAQIFDNTGAAGLAANIGGATGSALLGNAIVWAFGWNSGNDDTPQPDFAPPGAVIGGVWLALFGLMGAARWTLAREETDRAHNAGWLIVGLIAACFAYPFYSLGPDSEKTGLAGTVLTMALTVFTLWRLRRISLPALLLLLPLAAWLTFAAAILVRTMQLKD